MRISAKCDYACKAVLELALQRENGKAVQMQFISKRQNIPLKYLPQILIQLKRIGIVESVRGKQGGYLLAEDPERISLGRIVREIGGPLLEISSIIHSTKKSVFDAIWHEVEGAMADVLDKITFETIAKKFKGLETAIMYQI